MMVVWKCSGRGVGSMVVWRYSDGGVVLENDNQQRIG